MAEILHKSETMLAGGSNSETKRNVQVNQLQGELRVYNTLSDYVPKDIIVGGEVISLSKAFSLKVSNELSRLQGV